MRLRLVVLATLSGVMAWGGWQSSKIRAGDIPSDAEVLAAAGGDPGLFGGSDGTGGAENYRISALSIFSNVALHVKDNYVDPSRINPKEMLVASLDEIERQVAEVLVEDIGGGKVQISVPGQTKIITVSDVESLWEINLKLRDVFRFFEKHLPPQKDMRAVEYAAINGALSTLDPHSVLLKPEAFAEMKTSTKGEFGGLGIVISVKEGKLTIISPLDGTPASRAGLKALDVISRIGDVSTVSMPIEEAVQKLRGPEGSKVTIWVTRKGWPEAKKFTMTRERIKIESVESRMLDDRIGYVKIKNFQQNTGRDLDEHVEKLTKDGKGPLKGLVVDLRNNPGGLLEQAIRVSDKFLANGDIVTTVGYGNKLREPKRAQWSGSDIDVPLVVLVNNGSASASEIVAGALKNLDRALIVGERTFGKGSVQVLYDFADSSALKLTIAQYLTPGGVSIQNIGVAPDVALTRARIDKDEVHLFYEPEAHRESNLDKHLDRANEAEEKALSAAEAKPAVELMYLDEPEKKDATAEQAPEANAEDDDEELPSDSFREDYPIKIARQLLASSGANRRSDMLRAAKLVLEQRAIEEQEKIKASIEAFGVDWTNGDVPPASTVALNAELRIKSGATDGHIQAGTEVTLEATVTNNGNTPLSRVHGLIESDHQSFKGREFLFGAIPAGATKTWTVNTKVPKEAASRSDILSLKLSSNGKPLPSEAKLPVVTSYMPHPQFAYSYSFDDAERGDGDGVLERGEGVDMLVHVTNVGEGDADKVSLRLKSAAGEDLFLERGRVDVAAIPAGQTRTGKLRFKVRQNQTDGRENLPLELTIYDSSGEWLEDELAVVAEAPLPAKLTKKKGAGVTARDTLLRGGARSDAPVLATLAKGAPVTYSARVDDFFRVDLPDEAHAWIAATDVRAGRASKKTTTAMKFHPYRRPPVIHIDGQLGGRLVDEESVLLTGTISGRELRDMYVLLNDKKVYYAAGKGTQSKTDAAASADVAVVEEPSGAALTKANAGHPSATVEGWLAPDDQAVKLDFKQALPLKDGLNRILVVARLDERVVTYRNLFVSRIPRILEPAVAEANKAPAKPAATPSLPRQN